MKDVGRPLVLRVETGEVMTITNSNVSAVKHSIPLMNTDPSASTSLFPDQMSTPVDGEVNVDGDNEEVVNPESEVCMQKYLNSSY